VGGPSRVRIVVFGMILALLAVACSSTSDATTTTTSNSATTATTAATVTTATTAATVTTATTVTTAAAASFNLVKDGTLTVAVADFPVPGFWEGTDPSHPEGGLEPAIATYLAKELGLKVEFVPTDFSAIISRQFVGFDIFLDQVSITDERKKLFDFSEPYWFNPLGLMVMKGTTITTFEDIKNLVLGACAGCNSYDYIVDVIQPNVSPRAFQADVEKYTALESNQIDGAVGDVPGMLSQIIARKGTDMVIACRFPKISTAGILIRKDAGITQAVQAAMKKADADGTLDALRAKWVFPALGNQDPMDTPECPPKG